MRLAFVVAATLQNASTSTQPTMLLTRMNAGHGIDAPFSQRVGGHGDRADVLRA